MAKMARNIVVWSGGADSTWLLHHWAGASSEDHRVVALTVRHHRFLSKPFLKAQRKAQEAYLKLAKKRGYHIDHQMIRVDGHFSWGVDVNSGPRGRGCPTAQAIMWLYAIMQVVGDGDKVLVGYIKGDSFWHYRDEFARTFDAMCKLKGVRATLVYDLEWQSKPDILRLLKKARIPQRCWFSCESVGEDGKACGNCSKCDEIAYAKKHWQYKTDERPKEMR